MLATEAGRIPIHLVRPHARADPPCSSRGRRLVILLASGQSPRLAPLSALDPDDDDAAFPSVISTPP